jgi:hypothetical protein
MLKRAAFVVSTADVRHDRPVTIGVHPNQDPVRVTVTAPGAFEICPATIDGRVVRDGSWPSKLGFESCRPLVGRAAVLPATDGQLHVFFALRPRARGVIRSLSLAVTYAARDPFVMVLSRSDVAVRFVPRSATAAAAAYLEPNFEAVRQLRTVVSQGRTVISSGAACDFPSEIDCVGPITVGDVVTIWLRGTSTYRGGRAQPAMYLSWRGAT